MTLTTIHGDLTGIQICNIRFSWPVLSLTKIQIVWSITLAKLRELFIRTTELGGKRTGITSSVSGALSGPARRRSGPLKAPLTDEVMPVLFPPSSVVRMKSSRSLAKVIDHTICILVRLSTGQENLILQI